MKQPTLIGRLAWAQTLVTVCALGAVVVITWAGVTSLLTWRTDRVLRDLLTRTVEYLEAGPANESVDWPWLAGEIEEMRPRGVRFEVRGRQSGRALITLGSGAALGGFVAGCADRQDARVCGSAGRRYVAIAASDRSEDVAARNQLMVALAVACVVAAAGVALVSTAVTRRAIRPLSDLAARVAAIVPGSGASLVPRATLRELELLEQRFAELVTRFEQTLLREKHFTAHASHELRTPLTVARAEIEAIRTETDIEKAIAAASAALARLESLVQALLWFARAQVRLDGEDMDVVNLADVIAQQVDDVRRTHASQQIYERLPDEALVRGDEALLSSATANLIDNAMKHGGDSQIQIELSRTGQDAVLRIANGGAAIPEALREQLFVPFVRGAHGRPGFGLGLAFSRAVARAHGGDVGFGEARVDGTTVLMRLPLLAWHEEPLARFDSV